MSARRLLSIAGLLGLTGVALGAFGAHALHAALAARQTTSLWETAVTYQLIHSVALLALAGWRGDNGAGDRHPGTAAAWCWVGGVVLFSGSLYALALGAPVRWFWPVTPAGGLLFLAGWLLVIALGLRRPPAEPAA
ncbi:MAG TPA: DUF423 domain-containing protein [Opitutaceae bacterium]|nr:DUF423 domain-containing protein [Opitutaceae bacterium]